MKFRVKGRFDRTLRPPFESAIALYPQAMSSAIVEWAHSSFSVCALPKTMIGALPIYLFPYKWSTYKLRLCKGGNFKISKSTTPQKGNFSSAFFGMNKNIKLACPLCLNFKDISPTQLHTNLILKQSEDMPVNFTACTCL